MITLESFDEARLVLTEKKFLKNHVIFSVVNVSSSLTRYRNYLFINILCSLSRLSDTIRSSRYFQHILMAVGRQLFLDKYCTKLQDNHSY